MIRRAALLAVAAVYGALASAHPLDAAEPVVVEESFRARIDDTEQRYLRIVPADFDPRATHDLLLALHGHGSDRRQFAHHPRDECRAARDVAAKHRLMFVSPDYRAPASWMGPQAEADVVQLIDELKRRFTIGRVIVSGGSMGGTAALTFAALHPERIDGVVSLNGTANLVEFAGFQDAIAKSFGGTKHERPEEYRRRSAELRPEGLTMPIACTTGGRDTVVPPDSVRRLLTSLRRQGRPVLLLHRPGGGHATNYADACEAYEFVVARLPNR